MRAHPTAPDVAARPPATPPLVAAFVPEAEIRGDCFPDRRARGFLDLSIAWIRAMTVSQP